jgi:hypothetical protein
MLPILLERALSVKENESVAARSSPARIRRFPSRPGFSQEPL